MITRINKIKNLGLVFPDYIWNSYLPNFRRFNLIYGWNGSGKTTLSKLFDALETGGLKQQPTFEYEVEDDTANKYKQGQVFNKKVRIFNQDYIENNLKIRDGKAKAITLVLGDINKEVVEQIEKDTNLLRDKLINLKKVSEKLEQKNKDKNKTFTEIAKTIYVAITGGATRNYRKDNAEADFVSITQKELIPDADLQNFLIIAKQNSKPTIDTIDVIEVRNHAAGSSTDLQTFIVEKLAEAKILLAKTVESQIIKRLQENKNISDWVEAGLMIHNHHKSKVCEFCAQTLPDERIVNISKHFNEADRLLKSDVDSLITEFEKAVNLINNAIYPDKARFYDELQNDYEACCSDFDARKKDLLEAIKDLLAILRDKKTKTTETITLTKDIDASLFKNALAAVTDFITRHNRKTSDFETEKGQVINKLKTHYLSTIFDEVKVLEGEITLEKTTIDKLNNGDLSIPDDLGILSLRKRISENQKKISSTHKACGDINNGLATFLGRDELVFEPHKTKVLDDQGKEQEIDDGYIIKRGGKPVTNLSEGEKTAIAFVYFTIHLKDQDFDIKTGIVVIDDPISSLDSNSLFQAFAFLKNSVKEAEQVFVLTHNFDFLKLLLNWVKHDNHGKNASYYMIKNCYIDGGRCAFLDKMDKELCEYESEYHYLFKILKEFESDGTIGQAYPIPNIARKVLETFLMFRVPMGGSPYMKMEKIRETTKFDPIKLTAIYKFTNDQSHVTGSGFDPALVQETQKNVKYLLEMISSVFPEHYSLLEESIKTP